MADVEAIMSAKLPTWKLEHFGLWADVIQPKAEGVQMPQATNTEIMDLEEQAEASCWLSFVGPRAFDFERVPGRRMRRATEKFARS